MQESLKGKKALIIGGTSGIGAAVASHFAHKGADVWVAARNKGDTPHHFTPLDLLGSSVEAIAEIRTKWGAPDIIFFSSSSPKAGPLLDLNKNDWEEGLKLILTTPLTIAKAFLPTMESQGFGRLIFMSSAAAKEPLPGLELSGAMRAALRSVVRSLANTYCQKGITINALLPALVNTKHLRKVAGSEEKLNEWKAMIPMGRFAEPDEIAAYAAFLASKKAGYITGQSLSIDGGFTGAI